MRRYLMFTRLGPELLREPERFHFLAKSVRSELRQAHPEVHWVHSYALFGPYDVVDIFDAPSEEAAQRVALMLRSRAGVTTELYPAVHWDTFLSMVDELGRHEAYASGPKE